MHRSILILLWISGCSAIAQTTEVSWCPQQIPSPNGGLADPDKILSLQQHETVSKRLQEVNRDIDIERVAESSTEAHSNVQVAVAIVGQINKSCFPEDMGEEEIAETFSRQLHDTWGVGHVTDLGGTGALVFLSLKDRILYISRGSAFDRILTDRRLDQIMHAMSHDLKQAKYDDGIIVAIDEIVEFVAKGEPSWKETLFQPDNVIILLWCGFLGSFFIGSWRRRRQQIAYAQAASQLSEIDRAQAEALQGQYEATSCPICLETFKSSTEGSDGEPIKLLRCGHVFDETCWSQWVSSGQGNVTKCPICKMDIGQGPQQDATGSLQQQEGDGAQPMDPADATTDQGPNPAQAHPTNNRDMVRFRQERNFRLMRLQTRFPEFITRAQINRWSSPTYDGSLVRDPTFRQSNPRNSFHSNAGHRRTATGGSSHSSGGFSFGGGRSSGGRAGRF